MSLFTFYKPDFSDNDFNNNIHIDTNIIFPDLDIPSEYLSSHEQLIDNNIVDENNNNINIFGENSENHNDIFTFEQPIIQTTIFDNLYIKPKKKSQCICEIPNICQYCYDRYIDNIHTMKIIISGDFKKSMMDEKFSIYPMLADRLYKNLESINNGFVLDYDDLNKFYDCIIQLCCISDGSNMIKMSDTFKCVVPTISSNIYSELPVGDICVVEEYITYKIWYWFMRNIKQKNNNIKLAEIVSLISSYESNLQHYKFICDKLICPHEQYYYKFLNDTLFSSISYHDYKLSLHVCIYHVNIN